MGKDTILYFEDSPGFRSLAEWDLITAFSEYKRVFGKYGNKKEVDRIIKDIGGVEKIAIVCTDGTLVGGGKRFTINEGWETMRYLREIGYNGPAIYTGETPLPKEARKLYAAISIKKYGEILRNHIRNNIKG